MKSDWLKRLLKNLKKEILFLTKSKFYVTQIFEKGIFVLPYNPKKEILFLTKSKAIVNDLSQKCKAITFLFNLKYKTAISSKNLLLFESLFEHQQRG